MKGGENSHVCKHFYTLPCNTSGKDCMCGSIFELINVHQDSDTNDRDTATNLFCLWPSDHMTWTADLNARHGDDHTLSFGIPICLSI